MHKGGENYTPCNIKILSFLGPGPSAGVVPFVDILWVSEQNLRKRGKPMDLEERERI